MKLRVLVLEDESRTRTPTRPSRCVKKIGCSARTDDDAKRLAQKKISIASAMEWVEEKRLKEANRVAVEAYRLEQRRIGDAIVGRSKA